MFNRIPGTRRAPAIATSVAALLATLLCTSTMAFPTKVRLTHEAQPINRGKAMLLFTHKGTATVVSGTQAFDAFAARPGKKGECYVLETESESSVEFNVGPEDSQARSVEKVACK